MRVVVVVKRRWLGFFFSFLEGFAVTWNPFTMVIAVGFGYLLKVATKYEVTPMKNAIFLLGAFIGWLASYPTGGVPFYKWGGIWWMPTGLVVAAAIGIPVTWYLRKRGIPTGF